MRFFIIIFINIFCFFVTSWAQAMTNTTNANSTDTDTDAAQAQTLHLDWIDPSINPGQNFYVYANSTWQKNNPIPAAYSRWGMFHILQEKNQQQIKSIVESALHDHHKKPGSIEQKVGDFYYSGMDEATINKLGYSPLQEEFDRIAKIHNLAELQQTITHLQMIGVNALFDLDQMQDFKDSHNVIGVAYQGGLSLPDRDYYLSNDKKMQQIRQTFLLHISKMLQLLGDDPKKADAAAKTILAIETKLAQASMSLVQQRDPHAIYHMMTLTQLQQLTPNFAWQRYFATIEHPEIKKINMAMPDFFKTLNTQLTQIPLADWQWYLRWHLIHSFSPYLSTPFVKENFRMTAALSGTKELLPRWKRVLNAEEGALGFAIGKLYVEKYFPPSSKKAVQDMVMHIHNALKDDLAQLDWMSPATRKAALAKLALMKNRVGYPDKWWDYSKLQIDKGPYVLNIIRSNVFLNKRDLNKIGKPFDETEWEMPPQTVNAYYDPSMNALNIPAGILQPPFFDPNATDAINYGGIGFVIGHEMTHGFDDSGSQFDGHGNLRDWWTKEDAKKFKERTQCIIDQFSQYTVDGNAKVQGELVVGEATADLGGLNLAYRALHASDHFQQIPNIQGFTPAQQFFLSAAHLWAENIRPEEARRMVIIDPHPPAISRVNGTLANMPEFQSAYPSPAGSLMVNKKRCVIW